MIFLRELISSIILLIIICLNTIACGNTFSNILFTLFYVLSYLLYTNQCLSIVMVVILGIIFDSVNSISLGVSSLILVAVCFIYLLQNNKLLHRYLFIYTIAISNIIFIVIYIKLMSFILDVPFISGTNFFLISFLSISVLLPLLLIIKNSLLTNAK